jgi:hypothetical protein
MADTIKQRLDELTDKQVLEAGLFLATKLSNVNTPSAVKEQLEAVYDSAGVGVDELNRVLADLRDPSKAADSSRLLLTIAYAEGLSEEVETAIEGAGKKQDFGALTIVAPMVVLGLGILITQLKKKQTSTTSMKIQSDGTTEIKTENVTEYYSLGEATGHVLKTALEGVIPKNEDTGA